MSVCVRDRETKIEREYFACVLCVSVVKYTYLCERERDRKRDQKCEGAKG